MPASRQEVVAAAHEQAHHNRRVRGEVLPPLTVGRVPAWERHTHTHGVGSQGTQRVEDGERHRESHKHTHRERETQRDLQRKRWNSPP